jgi:hypothetical protein
MESWYDLTRLLVDAGYTVWQVQFAVDSPEGLHVSYWAKGRPVLEVVTHSEQIAEVMSKWR